MTFIFSEKNNNKKNDDELYTKILNKFLEISKYYEIEKKMFVLFLNILCDIANKKEIDAESKANKIYNKLKKINIEYGFEDIEFTKINNKNVCDFILEQIEFYEKILSISPNITMDGDIYNDDHYFAFIISYYIIIKNKSK
jgi:hypothetical protein